MIISAYISREILRPFALICAVLLLLMVSYSALALLADAESNLIPSNLLVVLIVSKTIAAFELFLPLALYITLLMGLGKLYSEHEISALHASGMSVFGLIKILLPLIISITLLTAVVAIFVRPWAYDLRYSAKYQAQQTYDFDYLEEGYFYENKDTGQVYFVRSIDNDIKNDLFVYQPEENSVQIVYADKGYQLKAEKNQSPSMVFLDGTAHRLQQHSADILVSFKRFTVFPESKEIVPQSFKRKAASTYYLSSSSDRNEVAEFQWRITSAFKAFFLAIIAILLAKTSPRQGRYGKLIVGILFFFVMHACSLVMKTWIEQGALSVIPGMWSVVAILIMFTIILGKRYS
ncbi:MAG: LPS export ABC transporter permease LptF [Gammaproteobacteria bacterium]|nr:LPS export ABC transporter permease LptF [Gammaproteobacteria bacterium]